MNLENHTLKTPKTHESLLISASEAATLLGIGRSLFYSLKAEGKLPAPVRLGSRVLWSKDEIQKWIEAGSPNRMKWEVLKKQV